MDMSAKLWEWHKRTIVKEQSWNLNPMKQAKGQLSSRWASSRLESVLHTWEFRRERSVLTRCVISGKAHDRLWLFMGVLDRWKWVSGPLPEKDHRKPGDILPPYAFWPASCVSARSASSYPVTNTGPSCLASEKALCNRIQVTNIGNCYQIPDTYSIGGRASNPKTTKDTGKAERGEAGEQSRAAKSRASRWSKS